MKMCAKCGGSMKKGGVPSKPKLQKGGVPRNFKYPKFPIPIEPRDSTRINYPNRKEPRTPEQMMEDYIKKERNKEKEEGIKREMIERYEEDKKNAKGGAIKKMSKGGVQKIVGMPGYNATTYPTTMKNGGAKKSLPKAQDGQATGPNPNPTGKKKFEDLLGAAAGIGGILGSSIYFNSDKAAAKQKARLEKRDARKEERQTSKDLAKSKRKEAKGFKATSGPSFKKGGATSFGMLSVKAGVDKNPKATAADRIAGAKMKKKMGGSTKKK